MNITFVCKRHYTNKDVVNDAYGRLYEIPRQLALLGHNVSVICLDYKKADQRTDFREYHGAGYVHWFIVARRKLIRLFITSPNNYFDLNASDLVFSSSDIPCLSLGKRMAQALDVPFVIDLYDNYESFGQARIPGFRRMLSSSINAADLIVCVSESLHDMVYKKYQPRGKMMVMHNGTNFEYFHTGCKIEARESLGLPTEAKLLGTAGALTVMKGLDTVYEAWQEIRQQNENLYLVLAGKLDRQLPLPVDDRVIYLGELYEKQVGKLFRALDIGIIPAQDSEFGRYCFPQKLYEMLACGLPLVAAGVGAIQDALSKTPEILYSPGSSKTLVEVLTKQLLAGKQPSLTAQQWKELVRPVETAISDLAR